MSRPVETTLTSKSSGGDYADEIVSNSEVGVFGKVSTEIRLAYYKECLCAVKMLQDMSVLRGVGGGSAAPLVLTRQDHVELISVRLQFILLTMYILISVSL